MTKKRRRSRYRFDQIPNAVVRRESRHPRAQHQPGPLASKAGSSIQESTGIDRAELCTSPMPMYDSVNGFEENTRGREMPILKESSAPFGSGSEECITMCEHARHTDEASNDEVEKNTLPLKNWRVLWALVQTCGSRRLTKEQYQSVRLLFESVTSEGSTDWKLQLNSRVVFDTESRTSHLPHYYTLYRTVKPRVFKNLTVRTVEHQERVNMRKEGARSTMLSSSGDPMISIETILPSEYARADVSNPQVLDAMYRTSLEWHEIHGLKSSEPRVSSVDCVDIIPLIAAREWFYGPQKHIYIDKTVMNVAPTDFAEAGDVIQISLITSDILDESFGRCFSAPNSTAERPVLQGKVLCLWTVNHWSRKGGLDCETFSSQLSSRDQKIRSLFDFVKYVSPSDSVAVVVPDVPESDEDNDDRGEMDDEALALREKELKEAKKRRRAAQVERRRQMEEAWSCWEKPIIKPGDVVALLCPSVEETHDPSSSILLTETDNLSRVLLVNRHWIEQEERSTHVLWVPRGSDMELIPCTGIENSPNHLRLCCRPPTIVCPRFHVYVRDLYLVKEHPGPRGPQSFPAISSFGILSTGEQYCVYRFVLFWDGFETQEGKEPSGDGIYLLCLNLSTNYSRTPNDVRIISLTPPGLKSDTVLRAITADVVKGMTEGFEDIDAEGNMRRIFLDLVGFIGDTPTLNAFLDILGRNACAYGHLCRYVRQSNTIIGSRYTGRESKTSCTASRRGFYQQRAVRDCAPGAETCRLLGLKLDLDISRKVLEHIRSEVIGTKSGVPKTMEGHPVGPSALDPCKACFIAPDHLLTGNGRDCINLALKLLPTRNSRSSFERFMLDILSACKLPTQTRLVNQEKVKMFGMSMTEMYVVLFAAPFAFRKVLSSTDFAEASVIVQQNCNEAVGIGTSVSKLITELWFKPDPARDSSTDIEVFEAYQGNTHISKVQRMVDEHIAAIQRICEMADCDSIAVTESTCGAQRKTQLIKERSMCILARKTVDKPNVHRFIELVQTTLPMFGHVSVFAELPL